MVLSTKQYGNRHNHLLPGYGNCSTQTVVLAATIKSTEEGADQHEPEPEINGLTAVVFWVPNTDGSLFKDMEMVDLGVESSLGKREERSVDH
jgi:hypothetical protein